MTEYEKLVVEAYGGENPDLKYLKAKQRMGPQLFAHLLIIFLILVANWVYLQDKKRGLVR